MMWPARAIKRHREEWIKAGGVPLDPKIERKIGKVLMILIDNFVLHGQRELVVNFFKFVKFILIKNGLQEIVDDVFEDKKVKVEGLDDES